ncbi:MAG: HsdR family type I site-specific deoxyribonuclease, partial [Candidatus Nomurabacteria bacterium]|nr:HsdR family type I site-specific deoxyribonuclease [Candidatus Nomurabacteria bacterium]
KEYDKFEKGAANSNTSTRVLQKQLEDPNAKIIITTIQKLSTFIGRNNTHEIFGGHIVIIFDECHRSQFGDMHNRITKAFKNYHLFGFTGTPIFAVNAGTGAKNPQLKTTEQAFGDKLHTYTIVDAITDRNVLPFRVDYVNTVKAGEFEDKKIKAIDAERALLSDARIHEVVKYILEHFAQKTVRSKYYKMNDGRRLNGFNSIFATASIDAAKRYYAEFKRQQDENSGQRLKVGLIYSYGANDDMEEIFDNASGVIDDENNENTDKLDQSSRDFLEVAIADYNETFGTNFDTSADKFQNYYKDLSLRIKNREIDLVIVVNMFLTGFDATTLNTLWVDKNLRQHGLLQAFSRTNRILNSVKTFGNIICFRNLEQATNDAISLFGDKEASGVVLLRKFDDYYYGYEDEGKKVKGYEELLAELLQKYPLGEQILSEEEQRNFIKLYGAILRSRNILNSFDAFSGLEILNERDFQDYQSIYLDFYREYRKGSNNDKENINDDVVFEIELIKQIEINIDYILMLVRRYHDGNCEDKEIRLSITKAIDSSLELRSKKDLIENFVNSLSVGGDVDEDWRAYISEEKQKELERIILDENLNREETLKYIERAFRDGRIEESGTDIVRILPRTSRFGGVAADGASEDGKNSHAAIKRTAMEKLKAFFERFWGV